MVSPQNNTCITHDITLDVYGLPAGDVPAVMERLALTAAGLGLDGFAVAVRIEQVVHHHAVEDEEVGP